MSEAGEIIGRLKLDGSQFFAELDRAQARAEELGAADPKIRVTTEGTGKAVAELEAVKVAEDHVEQGTRKIGAAQKDGARQAADWRGALVGGLVAVSAAAPPVAAGALGITGAFGVMAGAGVLGLMGIVRGLKENNAVGQEYRGTIDLLGRDFHSLQDSSARGLFPGIEKSTALLDSRLPRLNRYVQHFAGMLGAMLPTGLDATITLVERAEPLFDAAGKYLGRMVQGLDSFAHSQAYSDFLTYSIRSLPQVEHFLGSVVHLAGDFLAAWAPVGTATLPMLDNLVTTVDHIVTATGPLVPATIAVVGAYKLLSPAIGLVKTLTGAVVALGDAEVATAAKGAGLTGKGGAGLLGAGAKGLAAGAALGAGLAVGNSYETTDMSKQIFGQIAANKGVGGGSTITGQDAALARLVQDNNSAKAAAQFRILQSAAQNLGMPMSSLYTLYPKYSAAAGLAGKSSAAAGTQARTAVSAYDQLAAAALSAYTAQQKLAAGNQNLESTTDQAKDAVANVTASLKANGLSLDQNTAKGRANREAVLAAVSAITAHGDAINADGKHSAEAAVSNDRMAISLEKTMEAAGVSRKAAQAYVNQLLGIPKNRSTALQLKADEAILKAKQAKQYADLFAHGKYDAILRGDFTAAQKAAARAKIAAEDFAKGDYKAALKADPSPANKAKADAMRQAEEFALKKYLAKYQADPSNANKAAYEAALKAHGFATGFYEAFLRARSNAAAVAAEAQQAINAVHSRDVYITAHYASTGSNMATGGVRYGPADGGTMNAGGPPTRGMADGGSSGFYGTVTGPGTAWNDQAGRYNLADGEEVISNKHGQAAMWRRPLKVMNAGMPPAAVLRAVAAVAGQQAQSGPTTVITRTIAPQISIVNPVAVDPVQQVTDAAQYALAYAGLG